MKSNYTPEIRFSGFTGNWKQLKLGEIAEFNPKSNLPKRFEYVDLESVVGINLISHRSMDKETAPSRAQRLAKQGDVFFQTVRPYQKNNYLFDLPYDNFVFSTGYAQLRPYLNSYFLLGRIQEERFVSNVLDRCTGTSYPAINSSDLAQIEISVPSIKEEQTKIGNVLNQIDKIIAIYEKELTTLKEVKIGFLQKMFTKDGESFPEVRFRGFSEGWKRRRLKEFGNATGGTSIESEFNDNGKYRVISIGSYSESSSYTDQGIRVNETEKTKSRILNKGDLTMILNDKTSSGRIIGRVLLIDKSNSYVYNQRTERIEPDRKNYDSQFLYHFFNSPYNRSKIIRSSQGNTQIYVNWSSISEIEYLVPGIEEQKEIGNFFKKLDDMINLQKRELVSLKETKKAFLQKLFA